MVKLFCGHTAENIYDSYIVAIKDEAYDYFEHKVYPAVTHMEVCRECYDNYIDADLVLPTMEDEENYLVGNS